VDFWANDPHPEKSGRTDGVFWKTPHIVTWADGRPFACLAEHKDKFSPSCAKVIAAHKK